MPLDLPPLSEQALVSIVTPSLNQGRFLPAALASVRAQEGPRIEHIVVDGGSTDQTLDVLRDSEVRWTSEPDSGQSEAINKGIQLAKGEVIGWLNADDFYLPGALAAAIATFREQPATGMVYANYVDVAEDGTELHRNRSRPFDLAYQLGGGNVVPQPTVFLRREVLDAVGLLDPNLHYAMDLDLWIRVGRVTEIVQVDEYWAAFRLHPASKSVAQRSRFLRERRIISRRYGTKFRLEHVLEHFYAIHPRLLRPVLGVRAAWRRARSASG